MDRRALTRLRLAFVLLAAALLLPLALLARSMEARLEAQRRLRHEIVAERIFDEMERELTSLLEIESARPTEAYSAASTRVERWAPFVVGYYTRDAAGVHIVAQSQIDGTRAARLWRALGPDALAKEQVEGSETPALGGAEDARERKDLEEVAPSVALEDKNQAPSATAAPTKSKAAADKALTGRAPAAAILKQLNRGGDEREKVQRKLESKRRDTMDDPLAGMD